jgi:hypothetical protein
MECIQLKPGVALLSPARAGYACVHAYPKAVLGPEIFQMKKRI